MNALVITGTDTGVGKTWVGCALGRALTRAGRRVVAIKPVETGCATAVAGGEDGVLLAEATGQAEPRTALHRFPEPVSGALAAERAGDAIDLDALMLRIESLGADADLVLVEGAGGLLSPLAWEWSVTELARLLAAPVLVVGADRLGVVNHALLTLSALELSGLEALGVVLTAPAQPDASTGTNAQSITRVGGSERIVTVPRVDDPADAADHMAPVLQWLEDLPNEPPRSPILAR